MGVVDFSAGTIAQGIGVLASVVGIAAAVLYTFIGGIALMSLATMVCIGSKTGILK